MLTALVVTVFAVALLGGLVLGACSCRDQACATSSEKTWWRAKGLSVYAEPTQPGHPPRDET